MTHGGDRRLPPVPGEWIDRSAPLHFRFEGFDLHGYEGDTITSALWAAGLRTLGRSFKYHRPRGVLSAANHDVNALFQAGRRLNLRGDVTALEAGMDLRAVNTFGGLANDRARILDALSCLLPVGFYYKAFHTPKHRFPMWERLIRRLSGLGELKFDTPPVATPKRYAFCDLLVVGAGPSGLSAAIAAADAGLQVAIADENPRLGGSLGYQRGGESARLDRQRDLVSRIIAHPRIDLFTEHWAAGYYADQWVPLVGPGHIVKMRSRALVVAAGAVEQPAVFRNNDLPGVMLASAAQRLIYRHAVRPASRVVVLAANGDGYRAALDLQAHGIGVACIADLRPDGESSLLGDDVRAAGIRILAGHCVHEALGDGLGHLHGVRLCPLGSDGEADAERGFVEHCDGLLMSTGWAPAAALLYQAGARMGFDEALQQFVPGQLPAGVFAAGRVNGVYALEGRVADGTRAGMEAARHLGCRVSTPPAVPPESAPPSHPYPVFGHPRGKNFVDFDEDLKLQDFANAAREGFDNIELMKRYTTVGMGPSQGKHSNMNAIRILARIRGLPVGEVGTTTARPFYHPVPLSHLAGRGFNPERRTPLHGRHEAAGAVFVPAGVWQRPAHYGRGDDPAAAIAAEVAAVRTAAGLIDVGTLGKLEVAGRDAAEFLERVYTGRFANLKVGMTRYALMLDESGVIADDGVVARLGPDHFYFTTTTTGAAGVYRELQRCLTLWGLECTLVNATGAFAAVNLAGPRARGILGKLTGLDLSDGAFPYLGVREGEVAGVPARLMRVGFVGETGYEIHVPADCAGHLWDSLLAAGAGAGLRPFGVEAQRLLRLEKGHLIVGQDTDGLTSPIDAALDWAVKMDKPFFVGQRSLRILAQKSPKQRLAGFALAPDHGGPVPKECHLVIEGGGIAGRVTSIAVSAALGRVIGLAFVRPEQAAPGSVIRIRAEGGAMVQATVVPTPFYDPQGERQRQ